MVISSSCRISTNIFGTFCFLSFGQQAWPLHTKVCAYKSVIITRLYSYGHVYVTTVCSSKEKSCFKPYLSRGENYTSTHMHCANRTRSWCSKRKQRLKYICLKEVSLAQKVQMIVTKRDNKHIENFDKLVYKISKKHNINLIPQINLLGHQSWASGLENLLKVYLFIVNYENAIDDLEQHFSTFNEISVNCYNCIFGRIV